MVSSPTHGETANMIVVGGGIVGLATAREALLRRPGSDVVVLEKADDVATAQTGHNSGVIHAGLYYSPGSLKARLCRAGREHTIRFCDERGIDYRSIGKLVVATTPVEVDRMRGLAQRAKANGLELEEIEGSRLAEMEPNVRGLAALVSPTTGVVDFTRVARAMADQIIELGGRVVTGAQVQQIAERPDVVVVTTQTGEYRGERLVACAGLQADRLARMGGLEVDFRIVPFRGEYYQLPSRRSDVVRHLIYPVPDPALPFLGIHLSPTIDGRVTVGPNAVLGFAREGYRRGSVQLADVASYAFFPGMWRFAAKYARTGITEMGNSLFRRRYLELVRKYCPSIELTDLQPHPAGIRAQALLRSGSIVDDFLFRSTQRQLHLCNAPSPAATSAIPIASLINDRLETTGTER
ncbi:L-2-hydroxyglutarate oxidase [Pseudactinotalea sp. Z1732]|uniref:L-2-hydroxyglutarate oxidase n=1 Tax=Micrococcales TaxID=85006 RepID=UPI003C7DA4EE